MSGGGFISFMNSTIRGNRQLLKNKRKFKEKSQFYNISKFKKVNYQIKDSSEEEKFLKRKLKKSKNDKKTIIYSLICFIIFSISLNIHLGFFNKPEDENPSRKRLEKQYKDNIRIGESYILSKNWNSSIFFYKKATEFLPEKFYGHQRLITVLTEKCKTEYNSCIETRNYINKIKPIFLEERDELEKKLSNLRKIIKENYK
jgi:hypothetical protein